MSDRDGPLSARDVAEALAAFRSANRGGVVGGPEEQMRAALTAALPALRRQIAEEIAVARMTDEITQFAGFSPTAIPWDAILHHKDYEEVLPVIGWALMTDGSMTTMVFHAGTQTTLKQAMELEGVHTYRLERA